MATGSRFKFVDMQNPLFLHPSGGPTSISVPKLQEAADYRACRRFVEIQLASKRKLGFMDGSVTKSTTDETDVAQWETCNNMVISWLHNNISNVVKRSILFIKLASEVWKHLERRFMLTNGSRKYKLNKDLFSLKKNELSIADYYTAMSSLWEEIESMTVLPRVTTVSEEIIALLKAIETMKEESHLFQFLNGLNEVYGAQRSQLLMLSPLPSIEVACVALQQEKSQRDVLNLSVGSETEIAAMYNKGPHEKSNNNVCTTCGVKGHSSVKFWTLHGYPKWHYKHNRTGTKGNVNGKKWSGDKMRMTNIAQVSGDIVEQGVVFTQQQLQQLLAMMPGSVSEEVDSPFSGMINSGTGGTPTKRWIIDSGASDHMTASLADLANVRKAPENFTIKLPTCARTLITHIGDIKLDNGLKMCNVLHVPNFNHNLLSIHKLAKDNDCDIMFYPEACMIIDSKSKKVKMVDKVSNGLYYLVNDKDQEIGTPVKCLQDETQIIQQPGAKANQLNTFCVWHHKLGHTPGAKLHLIPSIQSYLKDQNLVCV